MNNQNAKVGPDSESGHGPSQEVRLRGLLRLAWLPIPLLVAAIIAARVAGLRESYMSEALRLVLSFTFYTLVSLGTLVLVGRSFLASGTPGLLLLECGVVLWSLAGTVGDVVAPRDANVNATIFNTGIFLAGLCHLAGAILSLRPRRLFRAPPLWLVVGIALALAALWFVTHAALAHWLPVFFIPGQGGTLVRYCVLISAIVMFVLSSNLLLAGQRGARTPFTSWYALAMLLLAVGLFGIMIQLSFGSVVNWLGRTAQWLGGLYLLLAAFAALRESDLPLLPSVDRSSPLRHQYGVGIAIVLAATAARFALSPALGTSSPFLTFYPAVILAALYGGLRAGLLTIVLSALIADYFWIEPAGQFAIRSPIDWITILFFLLASTMISVVIAAMHEARARLVLQQDHLEELVKSRTVELEREIVEHKQAEEALRESETKYRNLFENMAEEVHFWKLVRDESGQIKTWRVVDVNPPALKTWERKSLEDTVGRTADEIYPGATDHYMAVVQKIMTEGVPYSFEDYFPPPVDKYFRFTSVPFGEYFITTGADITGIKKVQITLQKAHDELELRVQERTEALRQQADLIELSHEAIIVKDLESRILFWSRGAEEAYGWTKAEAQGNIIHFFLKTRFPVPFDEHMAALTGVGHWEGELIHTRKDGSELTVLSRQVLQRDEAGAPIAIMEINIDITERKGAEIALQASEQRWATTLMSIGDAVIATDTSGSIVFMNAVAEDLTGWTLGNAVQKPIAEVFHIINEQTRLDVENPISRVLGEGMIIGLANHTLLVKKDGTVVPIDDSGAPIRDKEGNTVGVVLIFRDITERKQAEKALTLASAYNRNLIEASIDPLVTINPEGRISDVNAATEQATGYPRDELVGTDFSDYFTDPQRARAGYEMVFKEGLVRDYPLEIRHRSGHITTVLYNASVYRDDTGSVIGVFAAARDVSEQQKLEVQLRQAQKMEALGTLSGGIAHDFNNILAAIVGFTELLSGHIAKGSRDAHRIERIMEAAIRGRELVQQMLTFSRKTEQEKKPLRVSSIVKETVKLIRATTPATISVKVNTVTESDLILGDPTQIQQVLMNLCTNAAYAMRENGGSLDIDLNDFSVSTSDGNPDGIEPGLYVKLTVRDTGTGISPDIVNKIFDPFFTTKKLGEGTGLGLSVVHGIVKHSNGHITVESELGRGSTFSVYFPRITGGPEADAVSDDELPTGSERILLVDDEKALVEMGEDILAELGYEVISRMSSREALSLLKEDPSRFDLVITDQTMPEMTGVELAKEILASRPNMPIIICTGFSYMVDAEKAKAAGIKAFAMKPLTKREIARTIRKVLDG
jgi:PAS domain S-box-containing protein